MKKVKSDLKIVLLLIITSIILYLLQLGFFHSLRDTTFYILQDIAFLPLQVALVTVVLGKILNDREKREKLNKINMVISAFFSEAGTEILIKLTNFAENLEDMRPKLSADMNWTEDNFYKSISYLKNTALPIQCSAENLESLKILLIIKREFLIGMLQNPNLLEHDSFTDMLLAVFHITEELIARDSIQESNGADIAHLANDIERALRTLIIQWVYHIEYLSIEYPYLYSLEVRRNPFNSETQIVVYD